MKLRAIATIAVTVALAASLAGCSTSTSGGSSSGKASDKLTIGVSFDQLNEIRTAELNGIKAAAKAHGDSVDFVSADTDAQKQNSQIQDLIQTKKVDAIIAIAWNKDQIVSSIALAKASKIPFIAIDRATADQADLAFQITGDPVADGKLAAAQILAAGRDMTVLELVGALTDQNAVGRRDGFDAALKGKSNVTIAASVPTDWDPTKALDGTSNALQKTPNINAIFVPSDYLLPSVVSALKAAGRLYPVGDPKHIFIVTIDGDPVGCPAVKDKTIDADIATLVGEFGTQAVAAAHTAHSGSTVKPKTVEIAGLPLTQANYATTSSKVWGCK